MTNNVSRLSGCDCSASIVIYNNPPDMLRRTIESILKSSLHVKLHIVDNSPTESLRLCLVDFPIIYHFFGSNAGYGRGHNRALHECLDSKYHIIINPDIVVDPFAIENLTAFMDTNADVGMVCPKVLNEDGSIQPLNKRYPTIVDLFARRFLPKRFHFILSRRLAWYETRDLGYDTTRDVEFMTGCFMFCRTSVLKGVDGFDERYFMYFEDCDLGRKFQDAGYRTVYLPDAIVTHLWERASHKSIKMAWVLIANMVRYFNKWGWKWL